MMDFIKNSELIVNFLKNKRPWYFHEIIGINFQTDLDYEGNSKNVLLITFIIKCSQLSDEYVATIKFVDASDVTLNKVTRVPIGDRLIIHDTQQNGWETKQRYHVHDDNGYGEETGFRFIDFYCSAIEAIEIKSFERKITLE
ncbi:hypothetical protein [Carnobacterium divergens]|uniref:Uncharacterized protein n=1 Tax=Carnobacterium divergens DSM 20623 TaxID=1449336 RepID=A0A0R2I2I9_CARDV|nr:hypothetical protein [Carnobacterium divergens]KRN57750.1 hypothetical protein IV74_GL001005 [Carnobacterium divergens DSM 20623]MDO0874378.1 hypothetical protein [Carnobacterium divergens]SUX21714.1 Uncharacterised protein [Carnobacterium divergens]